jgi:hypothetical protein
MKFTKIKTCLFGTRILRALCEDGTILGVIREKTGKTSYFINNKPVKNKGATNKVFSKNVENFATMLKHMV